MEMRKSITLLLLAMGMMWGAGLKGQLVITEIMYKSPIGGSQDSLEYIELHNPTPNPVDITGYSFTSGITHTFSSGIVNPGGFLIVCRTGASFTHYYGAPCPIVNWFLGNLADAGEAIVLKNAQSSTVDSVFYLPGAPFPTVGNGDGHSITYCNRSVDNQFGAGWVGATTMVPGAICQGTQLYGNPGACCNFIDVAPPTILSAGAYNLDKVGIKFSEPVSLASTYSMNFAVSTGSVTAAIGSTPDSIILTLAVPLVNGEYESVTVSGVQDTACNTMVTDTFQVVNNYLTTQFPLIISEIMYDDPSANDSLEFIEIMNVNSQAVIMGGLRITGAFEFQFPEFQLGANQRVIIGRYPSVLNRVFTPTECDVFGWESGTLGDTGGHLEIWNSAGIIDSLTYSNASPWPTGANGTGHGITVCVEPIDDADPASWSQSTQADWTAVYNSDTIYATLCHLGCRTIGVEPSAALVDFSVHPNPSSTWMEVRMDRELEVSYQIVDLTGRVLDSGLIVDGRANISVERFASGVHLIQLVNEAGAVMATKKVLIY